VKFFAFIENALVMNFRRIWSVLLNVCLAPKFQEQ